MTELTASTNLKRTKEGQLYFEFDFQLLITKEEFELTKQRVENVDPLYALQYKNFKYNPPVTGTGFLNYIASFFTSTVCFLFFF